MLLIAGYYYYLSANSTTTIVNKVEETADKTQKLAEECDEKNADRFHKLDQRSDQRNENLEIKIRSEQRAGFQNVHENLIKTNQNIIKTLQAVTSKNNDRGREEEVSFLNNDTFADEEKFTIEHLKEMRNKKMIELTQEMQSNKKRICLSGGTLGDDGEGPDDADSDKGYEEWSMKKQTPYVTNIKTQSDVDDNYMSNDSEPLDETHHDEKAPQHGIVNTLNTLQTNTKRIISTCYTICTNGIHYSLFFLSDNQKRIVIPSIFGLSSLYLAHCLFYKKKQNQYVILTK